MHTTDRAKLISQLDFILKTQLVDGKEHTNEFIELIAIRQGLGEMRYLNQREPIPKHKGLQELLFYYPDKEFLQIVSMSKQVFVRTVHRIEGHPVFRANGLMHSRHKQADVCIQLIMVTMGRLGCDGNGASIGNTARGCDGSVKKFQERVQSYR